jgi:molecular chaperone GrpE
MGAARKKADQHGPEQEIKIPVTDDNSAETEVEAVEGELIEDQPEAEIGAEEDLITYEDLETLQTELEEAQAKTQEYLDGWQRALADFSNYKRRVERDQQLNYQNTIGIVVKRYLPILDDLERALNNRPAEGDGAVWAGGIELIYRKFLMALEADGVQPMQAEGEQFDPNLHEAISQEPSPDHESGQVIEVLQKGYLLGERVLRPAIVRVAE